MPSKALIRIALALGMLTSVNTTLAAPVPNVVLAEAADKFRAVQQAMLLETETARQVSDLRVADLPVLGPREMSVLDIRAALIQLVRSTGANDHLQLLRAQPEGRKAAIGLTSGDWTLAQLRAEIATLAPDALVDGAFHYPIFVLDGARLRVNPSEQLSFDRSSGAFLTNFGEVYLHGATVDVTGASNADVPEFRPFLVTAGSGRMVVQDSTLQGLGFGRNANFSGLSIGSQGLYRSEHPVVIENSRFRDLVSVSVQNGDNAQIEGNAFLRARGSALVLRGTHKAQITDNLFVGTTEGDAIRLDYRSVGNELISNEIYQPARHGVQIQGASHDTLIKDTLIWQAGASAVYVRRSDCVDIRGVDALGSRQKAVVLRGSRGSRLTDSRLVGARSSGLHVGDGPTGSDTRISGTVFAANRVGLSTTSPAGLTLTGNDFTHQFPRFLEGDVANNTPAIARDLTGRAVIKLEAGGISDQFLPPLTCHIAEEG